MRPLRSAYCAVATAAVAGLAGPSAAAPTPGCHAVPERPATFVCLVTPGDPVPSVDPNGGWIVPVGPVCAGDVCVGPFDVQLPGITIGDTRVAIVLHDGQTSVVVIDTNAPAVPLLPGGPRGDCPGDESALYVETQPYVCVHTGPDANGGQYQEHYVGTCLTGTCETVTIPTGRVQRTFADVYNYPDVPGGGRHRARPAVRGGRRGVAAANTRREGRRPAACCTA